MSTATTSSSDYLLVPTLAESSIFGSNVRPINSGLLHDFIQLLPDSQLHLSDCNLNPGRLVGSVDLQSWMVWCPGIKDLKLQLSPGVSDLSSSTVMFEARYDLYRNQSFVSVIHGTLQLASLRLISSHSQLAKGDLCLVFEFGNEWTLNLSQMPFLIQDDPTLETIPHWGFQEVQLLTSSTLVYVPAKNHLFSLDWRLGVGLIELSPGFEFRNCQVSQWKTQSLGLRNSAKLWVNILTSTDPLALQARAHNNNHPDQISLCIDLRFLDLETIRLLESKLWRYTRSGVRLKSESCLQLQWDRKTHLSQIICDIQVQLCDDRYLDVQHTLSPAKATTLTRLDLSKILGCTTEKLGPRELLRVGFSVTETGYEISCADLRDRIETNGKFWINYIRMSISKSPRSNAEIIFRGESSLGRGYDFEISGQYDYQTCQLWLIGGVGQITFSKWIREIVVNGTTLRNLERCPFSVFSEVTFHYEVITGELQAKGITFADPNSNNSQELEENDDISEESEDINYNEQGHLFEMTYICRPKDLCKEEFRFQCIDAKDHECNLRDLFLDPMVQINDASGEAILVVDSK